MSPFWWIAIIVGAYVFFSVAPSVTAFLTVFTRKTGRLFLEADVKGTYFEHPYRLLSECCKKIKTLPCTTVSITSFDDVRLTADYYSCGSDKTAVLVHGYNTPPLNNFSYQLSYLYERGFNCLLINQRAHTGSGGKRSGLGMLEYRDVLLWVQEAEKLDTVNSILVYGVSMGATSVSYASEFFGEKVKAIVIDCGYSSPYEQVKWDMKKRFVPPVSILPVLTLCCRTVLKINIKKRVTDSLKKATVPALFIHGTKDTTVPFSVGLENYNAYASEKQMLRFPAEHTVALVESVMSGDSTFKDFLDKYFGETQ